MTTPLNDDNQFTSEQLAFLRADTDEAEAGYSIEYLRTRRRLPGRPRTISRQPAVMVRIRMAPDQLRQVDERAAGLGLNRSEVIRRAISKELAAA